MNLEEDSDDWWNTSEIQSTSFKFDDEDNLCIKDSVDDENLSLLDLVSGVTLSGKSDAIHPSIDLYSLVSKSSVDYILNGSKTQEYVFMPYKDKVVNQSSIDLSNVVSNMCNGETECLEPFKTLSSKQDLLTYAIEKKNNSVILKVICFLANSLKPALMYEIFLSQPKAFHLYVNFLSTKGNLPEAIKLLDNIGQNKDAGILQFTNCLGGNKLDQLVNMKSLSNSYFLMDPDKIHLDNHIKLLEWQKLYCHKLDKQKVTAATCFEYFLLSEMSKMNETGTEPRENICKHLSMDQILCHWILLKIASSKKDWNRLSNAFITKNWYGKLTVSTSIPIEDILRILSINMAPQILLKEFLETISDTSVRLALAKKHKCYCTIVDILVDQKDKQALLNFKSEQPTQSESYFYADDALRNSVKWKN